MLLQKELIARGGSTAASKAQKKKKNTWHVWHFDCSNNAIETKNILKIRCRQPLVEGVEGQFVLVK